MKKVIKSTIVSLTVCLLLVVSGMAQSAHLNSSAGSAAFQRDRERERPKEREKPKDEKGRGDQREPKKDEKPKRKPDFF